MAGRILVVDDVATNRIVLKAKLAMACYDVIQAADGEQALELARKRRPDLILLDLAMPGMGGLEACRRLKQDPATGHIPVIVVTAHCDARSRIAALSAGAEDFLTKPADDAILAARVRSLLRARLLEEELDLHDVSRAALGFSEAQAAFAGPGAAREAANAPGRIVFIGPDAATAMGWRGALAGRVPQRLETSDRAAALRLARVGGEATAPLPEAFVISADLAGRGDGLALVSELRASPATANAAILVVVPQARPDMAPMALDLGASDLVLAPFDPEELALRLSRQIARRRRIDALRRRMHAGLELAVTDALTGLPNRRYALSHLERSVERARLRDRPLTAVLLDLDRFKQVNDRHGHAAGDAVLRIVAQRLQAGLRAKDLVARIGGEEFLLVLHDVDPGEARAAADRLRRAIGDAPVALPGPEGPQAAGRAGGLNQTVSVGIAHLDRTAREGTAPACRAADALLALADRALYTAKAAGRDRVVEARPGQSGHVAA